MYLLLKLLKLNVSKLLFKDIKARLKELEAMRGKLAVMNARGVKKMDSAAAKAACKQATSLLKKAKAEVQQAKGFV